jgi:hypothetical protein
MKVDIILIILVDLDVVTRDTLVDASLLPLIQVSTTLSFAVEDSANNKAKEDEPIAVRVPFAMHEGAALKFDATRPSFLLIGESCMSKLALVDGRKQWQLEIDRPVNRLTIVTGPCMVHKRTAISSTRPVKISVLCGSIMVRLAPAPLHYFGAGWEKLASFTVHPQDRRFHDTANWNASTPPSFQFDAQAIQKNILSYVVSASNSDSTVFSFKSDGRQEEAQLSFEDFPWATYFGHGPIGCFFDENIRSLLSLDLSVDRTSIGARVAQLGVEALYGENILVLDHSYNAEEGDSVSLPPVPVRQFIRRVVLETDLRPSAIEFIQKLGKYLHGMEQTHVTIRFNWYVDEYSTLSGTRADEAGRAQTTKCAGLKACNKRLWGCLDKLLAMWKSEDGLVRRTDLPFAGTIAFHASFNQRCHCRRFWSVKPLADDIREAYEGSFKDMISFKGSG